MCARLNSPVNVLAGWAASCGSAIRNSGSDVAPGLDAKEVAIMVECKQRTSIFANLKLFIHIIDEGKHSDQDSLNASSLLLEPEPATTGLRYAGQMRLSTRPATASGPVSLPRMLSLIHTTTGAVGSELTLDLKTDFFTNCDRQPVFIRGRFHDIRLDIHFMKLGAVNIGLARNSYIL